MTPTTQTTKPSPCTLVRDLPKGSPVYNLLLEIAYCQVMPPPFVAGGSDTVEQWLASRLADRPIGELQASSMQILWSFVADVKDRELVDLLNAMAGGVLKPAVMREMEVYLVLNRVFHRPKPSTPPAKVKTFPPLPRTGFIPLDAA